jgi:hypothetical protein
VLHTLQGPIIPLRIETDSWGAGVPKVSSACWLAPLCVTHGLHPAPGTPTFPTLWPHVTLFEAMRAAPATRTLPVHRRVSVGVKYVYVRGPANNTAHICSLCVCALSLGEPSQLHRAVKRPSNGRYETYLTGSQL